MARDGIGILESESINEYGQQKGDGIDACLKKKIKMCKISLGFMNGFCICDILGTADDSNSWQGGDGEMMLRARDSVGKQEMMGSALLCIFG